MADITQNPPKDETTPGQSIESRKTGDKKVVEELQEFNTQTKEMAKDAKLGFNAIVEGIKAGNAEMNPEAVETQKIQVKGFQELSAAQENVVELFKDMKSDASRSQGAMAKDMAIEKGNKLEAQQEQVGLWGRMLMRLVGIDEDMDKLIENTTPVPGEKSWFGKMVTGLLLGGIVGLVGGIIFGFTEVLFLYAKLLVKGITKVGGKFVNSKFMAPIVDPIKGFFKNIGKKVGINTKGQGLFKTIGNTFKNVKTQFLHGLFGKKGGVGGLKGTKGFGTTKNIFTQAGAAMRNIKGVFSSFLWGPGSFGAKTKSLWKGANTAGKTTKGVTSAFGGFFKGIRGFFRGLGMIFKPVWAFFKIGLKVMAPIGRVFGRLFLPLTIIMGLVDGIRGFIDGFKNTEGSMGKKVVGGLIGAVKGIVNGLIMMPLDMLKKAVAWVMGIFGFDGMKKGLESFSFQEMYSKFVDMFTKTLWAVVDWFKLLFSDPGAALMNLVKGIGNIIMNFYKGILRFILPDPKGGKWYNPLNMIQKVIPDSVYTWAGLDPDTGERIPQEGDPGFVGPPAPEDPLLPTPESKSTIGRWGDTISGWWNSEDELDPVKKLKKGEIGPPNPDGSQNETFIDTSIRKGGDVINIMTGRDGGSQTAAAVGGPGGTP